MDEQILNKIKLANSKDPRKAMTVSDKMVKLQEEIGEIGAAHMKELGLKPLAEGETRSDVRNNKKEEYADALIVLYDIILADGFNFEEIKEEINKGVDKWHNKVAKLGMLHQHSDSIVAPTSVKRDTNVKSISDALYYNVIEKNHRTVPWVIYFTSNTCGACSAINKVVAEFSVMYKDKVHVAAAEANDGKCVRLFSEFKIDKTPVLVLMKNGKELARYVGKTDSVKSLEDEFLKYM